MQGESATGKAGKVNEEGGEHRSVCHVSVATTVAGQAGRRPGSDGTGDGRVAGAIEGEHQAAPFVWPMTCAIAGRADVTQAWGGQGELCKLDTDCVRVKTILGEPACGATAEAAGDGGRGRHLFTPSS